MLVWYALAAGLIRIADNCVGVAVVVLEREDHARARGARLLARADAYAAGFEPTLTSRAPQHAGVVAALRRALAAARRSGHEIGCVLTSAHGTPLDACERAALDEVLGSSPHCRRLAPKAALGETFGASGALCVALAIGLMPDAAQQATLISSLCYSGSIAAMVLSPATRLE